MRVRNNLGICFLGIKRKYLYQEYFGKSRTNSLNVNKLLLLLKGRTSPHHDYIPCNWPTERGSLLSGLSRHLPGDAHRQGEDHVPLSRAHERIRARAIEARACATATDVRPDPERRCRDGGVAGAD